MKRTFIALTLLICLRPAISQERLGREEAVKYAALVAADLKQLQGTPIPSNVDLKQPVAMRDGEFACMLLPETKLSLETLAKATDKVAPLGQLWLLRVVPMSAGQPVPKEKLRLATIEHEGEKYTLPQCALGVRKASSGGLDLLIFGKDKEPLLKVALTQVDAKQESPLDMDADRESDSAQITLKILGRYQAKFKVTQGEF